MLTSARRAISYPNPDRSDTPDIPAHILNLVNAIDLDTPFYTGTAAAKPAANTRVQGSWYWETDTSTLYFNNGASWIALAPLNSPALTGNPTATTQAVGDNSTRVATTAFVRSIIPPGVLLAYVAAAAPAGWLLCDGSAQSRSTFAALFAVIGTAYGAGDGSTTFNLPDLRGRVPIGSGTAAGANGATAHALGSMGGEETHLLSTPEMPAHTHTGTTTSVSAGTPSGTVNGASAGTPTGTVVSASAGTPSGSVHSQFSGSGGAIANSHISTATTGLQAGDANAGDALLSNSFTGNAMAAHGHSFVGDAMANHGHTFTGNALAGHTHTFTSDVTGGGGAHNNMQPFTTINYIIKT